MTGISVVLDFLFPFLSKGKYYFNYLKLMFSLLIIDDKVKEICLVHRVHKKEIFTNHLR